jgi:hypothetical protein
VTQAMWPKCLQKRLAWTKLLRAKKSAHSPEMLEDLVKAIES